MGITNYTFFIGQRFWFDRWEKLGWRFLLINVELSEEHLKNSMFIGGAKEGLTGKLNIGRVYLDYYPFDFKKGFLEFAPIVSAGLGYNRNLFTKNNESVHHRTLALSFAARLAYTFFDIIFLEFPVVDFSIHTKRQKTNIGDTYFNFPEYFSIYMWINLGLNFRF